MYHAIVGGLGGGVGLWSPEVSPYPFLCEGLGPHNRQFMVGGTSRRMALRLKTVGEMDAMAAAGSAVADALRQVAAAAQPGVLLLELEGVAREALARHNANPALLGYHPAFSQTAYQFATCLSLNDEVIHGTPRKKALREGDVLGIDMVGEIEGWYADSAITVAIGTVGPRVQKLLRVTEEALYLGIQRARPGNTMGDIGSAVQRHVEKAGFSVLRNMVGHGVGTAVHEAGLDVPNFGRPGGGIRLEPGMTFAIEPMVAAGRPDVKHRRDDPWAVVTKDGHVGAHFEHTVGITEDGVRVLTLHPDDADRLLPAG